MLDTWEGGWDSGSSCWTLGRVAGKVDFHVGHLGREAEPPLPGLKHERPKCPT